MREIPERIMNPTQPRDGMLAGLRFYKYSLTKMTREIKFRAWDKGNKRMEWFDMFGTVGKVEGIGWRSMRPLETTSDNLILMQYTNLKDKNGKEIYEGDILESTYQNRHGIFKKQTTVKSSDEYRGNGEDDDDTIVGGWVIETEHFHPLESFKVIGNIYENPELLK
jgi:uncharacterized phage protein (TIGR01671 family)